MSASSKPTGKFRMWGGRFSAEPDPRALALLVSLPVDRRLLRWDLVGSLGHVIALGEARIIPPKVAADLAAELRQMLQEADAGALVPEEGYEDIHSFVEATLGERVGPAAGWLHTGRSRNDQVATAFRLALKDEIRRAVRGIAELQERLLERAHEMRAVIMPSYTHLQRAQPVLVAHLWLAYFWMLSRDAGRLRDAYRRLDVLPLGSGAIAGTGFPVDRTRQAVLLGFAAVSENSVDATGDRDFALEAVAAASGLLVHLSRWAEELVLWTTKEFDFARLPDSLMTGSSLMPQKKNPDLLELVRAQAGVALGSLVTLGTVMKGVPLGYNRDLQEDKAPSFAAFRAVKFALEAMSLVVAKIVLRPERMAEALRGGFLTATEVADYLVRRGIPFREAHGLAGKVVLAAEAAGCELWELPLDAYRRVSPQFDLDVIQAVTPEGAVAAKDVPGGTAPRRVGEAMGAARADCAVTRAWCDTADADHLTGETRLLAAVPV